MTIIFKVQLSSKMTWFPTAKLVFTLGVTLNSARSSSDFTNSVMFLSWQGTLVVVPTEKNKKFIICVTILFIVGAVQIMSTSNIFNEEWNLRLCAFVPSRIMITISIESVSDLQ
jgi:hypothetical protein